MLTKIICGSIIFGLLMFLTGCTQTAVKYQCADGSFVDAIDSCPSVEYKRDCPQLDCSACPAKIEYKDREVEKEVYVDKLVYKYQCFDGSSEDNIVDCSDTKAYTATQTDIPIDTFCTQEGNKGYEKIAVKNAFEENEYLNKKDLYKYYPSLNEGWIYYYPVYIENAGCTKLEMKKFLSKASVYLGSKLVHSHESQIYSLLNAYMYPKDESSYNIALADYDEYNEEGTILIAGADQGPIKITSAGNYVIRISIYYNSKKIADIEDVLAVS